MASSENVGVVRGIRITSDPSRIAQDRLGYGKWSIPAPPPIQMAQNGLQGCLRPFTPDETVLNVSLSGVGIARNANRILANQC